MRLIVALNSLESISSIPKASGNKEGYPTSVLYDVDIKPEPTSLKVEVEGSINLYKFSFIFYEFV